MLKRHQQYGTATIASGDTKTGAIPTLHFREVGYTIPAAFTGTYITFERSFDGTTFAPFNDVDDNAASQSVTAGKSYNVPPEVITGAVAIKLVSGSAEGANRSIAWGMNS